MSEAVLRIDGLQTYYGKIHALKGISLSVQKGQIVTLLGANGAGKSTTLKTISGLVRSAAGRITFLGKDITTTPPHDIVRMGLIQAPEGRRIFKGLSVQENLDLGGFTNVQDKAGKERRLQYIFELFPILFKRRKQDSALLSGGEQQMLAIARAMMSGPKLLMLDEPSLGLAPIVIDAVYDAIQELRRDGVTVLLVEQNAERALSVADRAYLISTGQIVFSGTSQEIHSSGNVHEAYFGLSKDAVVQSRGESK